MPGSSDLAIFVLTTDDRQINRLLYPLLHMRAWGNYILLLSVFCIMHGILSIARDIISMQEYRQ